MSVTSNKIIVEQLIAEVWNNNKLELLDSLLSSDYYDFGNQPRNQKGLERTLEMMHNAFPDHKTTIEEIIGEGDTVTVCLTLRGTHQGTFRGIPPTGKKIEIGGYRWYKVLDGKIASHRGLLDLPTLLQQLDTSI